MCARALAPWPWRLERATGTRAVTPARLTPARRHSCWPQDAEEQEYLENLFDALCSCLMLPENRAAFVAAEVRARGARIGAGGGGCPS